MADTKRGNILEVWGNQEEGLVYRGYSSDTAQKLVGIRPNWTIKEIAPANYTVVNIATGHVLWSGEDKFYASSLIDKGEGKFRLEEIPLGKPEEDIFAVERVSVIAKTWTFNESELILGEGGDTNWLRFPTNTILAFDEAGLNLSAYMDQADVPNTDGVKNDFITALVSTIDEFSTERAIFLRDGQTIALFGNGFARLV